MKLYYVPISTYSQKVMVALAEKGVDYEREHVGLGSPEGREKYREIYPIGKVPLLMVGEDHMVPESTIIIEYLENHVKQGTRLIPDGVEESRQVRFMDRMCDLYLNDPMVKIIFEGMKPEDDRDPEVLAKSAYYIDCSYGYLDRRLGDNEWICGDAFSMADCAAYPPLFYAANNYPFVDYPNISRYFQQLCGRESVQQVQEEVVPALEAFMNRD